MAAQGGLGPMLLVLHLEEESRGRLLDNGKVKEMDFPLEPTEVTQSCTKLDLSPVFFFWGGRGTRICLPQILIEIFIKKISLEV